MSRDLRTALMGVAILASTAVHGQTPNLNLPAESAPVDFSKGAAEVASDQSALDIGPLRFTLGPTEDGFIGTALKGEGRQVFGGLSTNPLNWLSREPGSIAGYTTSLGYVVDGGWAGGDEANNNFSVSLRPGFDWLWMTTKEDYIGLNPEGGRALLAKRKEQLEKCKEEFSPAVGAGGPVPVDRCRVLRFPIPRISIGTFGDLRYRYGYFSQDEQRVSVNQAILGAGLRMTVFAIGHGWVNSWPRLSVGYYTVKDTETSSGDVPDDIESDVVKLDASAKFNLWNRGKTVGAKDYALRLYLDIEASKPTEGDDRDWQSLYQVQLLFKTDGEFKPALTYREGEEQGLDYDKQVIFGLLYELANR